MQTNGVIVLSTVGVIHLVAPGVVEDADVKSGGGGAGGVGDRHGDSLVAGAGPCGGGNLTSCCGGVAIRECPSDVGDGVNANDVGRE